MKYLSKLTLGQRKWLALSAGAAAILVAFSAAAWAVFSGSRVPLDTSTLTLDAWGCVATTPTGEPLKQALGGGLKTIPQGTTFTAQCFGPRS